MHKNPFKSGFTIVELLIVIVVIGILAAIVIVAYNGVQSRSQTAKINSDLTAFSKAIHAARINRGDAALMNITVSTATGGQCVGTADGVDIADKTAAAGCWAAYNNALNAISTASQINIRNLSDPWGRPYHIDENEKEGGTACGTGKDSIGVYPVPRVSGSWTTTNTMQIPYVTPGCV